VLQHGAATNDYPPKRPRDLNQWACRLANDMRARGHVLPNGFQHIRYYGFLGNRYREEKLAQCRELLGMSRPEPVHDKTDKDYRHRYEELTSVSLIQCPVCRLGRMAPFRSLRPFTTASSFMDTS
jgi:hypothetical protein